MTVDLVGNIVNAVVIGIGGLLLAWYTKGQFRAVNERIDRVERSLDALRSDLTQVALAVGAQPRAENA